MKLRLITAVTLGSLLFSACVEEVVSGVSDGDGMTLSAGLPSLQTRTWLDYASGGSPLKVYWSDGDRINVNGQASLPVAVADGEKKSEADFQLPDLAAPFNIIYPHEIVKESSYDAKGTIAVELPSVQAYDSGSFANGAAVMYGHAQTPDKVTLHNLCAAVRVPIKGTDDIVEARLFSASKDAPLCGTFRFSPETGALVAVEGKDELKLDIEEISLNQEKETDFYFCIPAGNYPEGLTFFFTRKGDRLQMQNIWYPKGALEAGKLYSFNDVEYVPMAKDIETVEEWEEFAAAMNDSEDISKYLYAGGFVRLGADLEAGDLTSITATFPYVFDGNGKTITRNKATSSLFSLLTGEIHNLTLAGELNLTNAEDAPFVKHICAGAKITGCTNNMNITFDIKTHCYVTGIAAVAVRNDIEGLEVLEISDCTNNGKIEGTVDVSAANYNTAVAGIIGDIRACVGDYDYSLVLKNCKNTAPITLSPKSGDTNTYGMTVCGVGGIIGYVRSAVSIELTDCDNSGDITVKADYIASKTGLKATPTAVGGIIGIGTGISSSKLALTGLDYTLTGCDNSATIYNCMVNSSEGTESSNKVYTGGLAGALVGKSDEYVTITSCTNTGDVYSYDVCGDNAATTSATSAVAGGFIGFGGNLNMDKCTVNCMVGNGKRQSVAWGGVLGFAMRPFNLTNSTINVVGYFNRISGYNLNRGVIAVIPVKYGSSGPAMSPAPTTTQSSTISGSSVTCKVLTTSGYPAADLTDNLRESTATEFEFTSNPFSDATKVQGNLTRGVGSNANAVITIDVGNTFKTGIL